MDVLVEIELRADAAASIEDFEFLKRMRAEIRRLHAQLNAQRFLNSNRRTNEVARLLAAERKATLAKAAQVVIEKYHTTRAGDVDMARHKLAAEIMALETEDNVSGYKPTICLDFDGCLHRYSKGWQDGKIYDDMVPGFFDWAEQARQYFKLMIYSSRSSKPGGIAEMREWLSRQFVLWAGRGAPGTVADASILTDIDFAVEKPPAFLTIDDRCIQFRGQWLTDPDLTPASLLAFKPWTNQNV